MAVLPAVQVNRLERSRRFVLHSSRPLTDAERQAFAAMVHDRMTEEVYDKPVRSFTEGLQVRQYGQRTTGVLSMAIWRAGSCGECGDVGK